MNQTMLNIMLKEIERKQEFSVTLMLENIN